VTRIAGRTSFARSPEDVFDFLTDPRNEPAYNPRILSATKVTPGPIGPGTRFVQLARAFGRVGEVRIDLVHSQRPRHLSWTIRSTGMQVRGDETITAGGEQTVVRWVWDFQPRGLLRLLGPIVGMAGRRLEQQVWADLRRYLETMPRPVQPWRTTPPSSLPTMSCRRHPAGPSPPPLALRRTEQGW
jgi:carbon monoxide dehydrogenase subunit G